MRCLITGANSGIGRAAALQLAAEGRDLILGCRSVSRGEAVKEEIAKLFPGVKVDVIQIDLSSMQSVKDFATACRQKFTEIDCLIHNAANFDHKQPKRVVTEDGFESVIATNHLGPFLLTSLLMPLLEKSNEPKMITVGTKGLDFYPFTNLDFDDLQMKNKKFGIAKAYYNSKLAHIMFTREFAKRYGNKISANCVRVTNVKLGDDRLAGLPLLYRGVYSIKKQFSISPEEMAKAYLYLVNTKESHSGLYIDEKMQVVTPPKKALDDVACEKLWEVSEKLVKKWSCV